MTEQEALIRAREAAANVLSGEPHHYSPGTLDDARSGKGDSWPIIQSAKRALLDLDKPLPVDRDLADLRELIGALFRNRYDWNDKDIASLKDTGGRGVLETLPTFRAIIQRRIEEARA